MQRRTFLLTLAGGVALALPAVAGISDDIVAQLAKQGYQDITVTKTWLGRVRIVATRDGGTREIVMNPRTGEILRDLWTGADGSQQTVSIVDDVKDADQASSSGDGSGSGSDGGNDSSGSDNGSGQGSGSGSSSGSGSDDGGSDNSGSSGSSGSGDSSGSGTSGGSGGGGKTGSGGGGHDDGESEDDGK